MKKIICFIVLLFTLNSCGTDYFYSSFTIRRELLWLTSLSEQTTLDTRAQITGTTTTFNRFSSPSIIATPANYLIAIYENRTISASDLDLYGINGRKKTEVTARISKDSASFDTTVTVGNTKGLDPTVAHGSPVSFLTKNGDIVVLSTGGAGFAQNLGAAQKTTLAVSISTNNGYEWTDWSNLDEKIFESLLNSSYDRFYTTPGNGITLRNGTLACMIDYKRDADVSAQGAAILYSKDDGKTWQLGGTLQYNGNGHRFAKIIAERTDGKLLIASVKDTGKNDINVYKNTGSIVWYLADTLDSSINTFSVTSPVVQDPTLGKITLFDKNSGGVVSGSSIKYHLKDSSTTIDGIILAHSYPQRKYQAPAGAVTVYNVTALSISADDGKTWTMITNVVGKEGTNFTAFRHSGLMVFRDGSIGLAYEEGVGPSFTDRQGYIPYYRRFGLSAISGGVYSYEGL